MKPTDLVWFSNEGVVCTALLDDVADEMLLAIVGGQDGDALRRVANETHVHEESHHVLRFCQVLHTQCCSLNVSTTCLFL